MAHALNTGVSGIVITFDHYSAFNGAGSALLTRLLSETRAEGTPVRITGLTENFKAIFDMLGIRPVAPCFDTLAEAILSIQTGAGDKG